jgi:hypothetical protein
LKLFPFTNRIDKQEVNQMTGIFYIILVPIIIIIISFLITNSSKGTSRDPGHSTYYGGEADNSNHCGGFDGGFGGGDGGGGGG